MHSSPRVAFIIPLFIVHCWSWNLDVPEHYGPISEAVIVLGRVWSRKDELTLILAGDNGAFVSSLLPSGKLWIHNADGNRIEDAFEKINYPVLIKDAVTGQAFYNCPAFAVQRSSEDDFVADYFMNKMIKSVGSVKFLVPLGIEFMMPGGNRGEFLLTLQGISNLIPDLDKFFDSIILVPTRAHSTRSEAEIYTKIQLFLSEVEGFLKTEIHEQSQPQIREEMTRFLNLTSNFCRPDRVVIFREPNKKGLVSANRIIQGSRKKTWAILENTPFVTLQPGDFTTTAILKSDGEAKKMLEAIVEQMKSIIKTQLVSLEEIVNLSQASRDFLRAAKLLRNMLQVLQETKQRC